MTALGLLTEVVKPKRKEWVIQNGANSAVRAFFCKSRAWELIGVVRRLGDV
jgi:hypothetical protein